MYIPSGTADNCGGYSHYHVIKDSGVMETPTSDFTASRNFLLEEEHRTLLLTFASVFNR